MSEKIEESAGDSPPRLPLEAMTDVLLPSRFPGLPPRERNRAPWTDGEDVLALAGFQGCEILGRARATAEVAWLLRRSPGSIRERLAYRYFIPDCKRDVIVAEMLVAQWCVDAQERGRK